MRKRRHSTGLAFIVKVCILMTVSLTFLLYLTTDKEYGDTKTHDEVLDWEEYFKKVQKMTKPPSPEILEKLKEGMSRLGGDHEKVLYIRFAENSIRKQMENRTKNDHVGSRIREHSKVTMKDAHVEIQKEKAPKKTINPIDADRQTINRKANNTNEKTNQVNSKRKQIVRNNILPRSLEYPKNPLSRNSEGEVENVEEVYEIGANQNRQFLQVNKMTFSSLNRDDQMSNPSGNAGEKFSDNGVTKDIPARKKRISNDDEINKYGRTQTFQDIALQSNSKAEISNITLRNVSESEEITFVFPFESYDANSSVDLRTDSSQISGGALKLIPEDAGYNDMQISRILEEEKVPIIADNIYWSSFVEDHFKTGLNKDEITTWSSRARHLVVTKMRNPDWKTCGRPLNQFIVMKDGSRMCARYRHPHTEFVQGEVYSFYLARLLGITHVPAVVLSMVNSTSRQWRKQTKRIKEAKWEEGTLVALIQWIDNLDRGKLPEIFLQGEGSVFPESEALRKLNMPEIVEVMQWTDLIIFDYITGNYDRIASNQDAAEKEHIPEILADNIHNLRRDKQTNTIWLIDNESGFLDGYELMRNPKKSAEAKRFISFHKQMLNSICIFRKSTIRNLNKLHFHGNPAEMLLSEVHRHEPLSDFLPKIPEKLKFHETMKSRISDVYDRVQLCKRRFRRSE